MIFGVNIMRIEINDGYGNDNDFPRSSGGNSFIKSSICRENLTYCSGVGNNIPATLDPDGVKLELLVSKSDVIDRFMLL